VVLSCTRARRQLPIIELCADHEIGPPLIAIPGEGCSFARWFSDQLMDQVDVVDVLLINAQELSGNLSL